VFPDVANTKKSIRKKLRHLQELETQSGEGQRGLGISPPKARLPVIIQTAFGSHPIFIQFCCDKKCCLERRSNRI